MELMCDTVYSGRNIITFQMGLQPLSLCSWSWRQYGSTKHL